LSPPSNFADLGERENSGKSEVAQRAAKAGGERKGKKRGKCFSLSFPCEKKKNWEKRLGDQDAETLHRGKKKKKGEAWASSLLLYPYYD